MEQAPLYVYHARQDDPRKCTARRMSKFGLVTMYETPGMLPSGAILMDPTAGQAISPGGPDACQERRRRAGLHVGRSREAFSCF